VAETAGVPALPSMPDSPQAIQSPNAGRTIAPATVS
jgi:hypothetical protein